MPSKKNKKTKIIAKDNFFTREMISTLQNVVMVRTPFKSKIKNHVRKQIKFLRELGLLANSHKHLSITIN